MSRVNCVGDDRTSILVTPCDDSIKHLNMLFIMLARLQHVDLAFVMLVCLARHPSERFLRATCYIIVTVDKHFEALFPREEQVRI